MAAQAQNETPWNYNAINNAYDGLWPRGIFMLPRDTTKKVILDENYMPVGDSGILAYWHGKPRWKDNAGIWREFASDLSAYMKYSDTSTTIATRTYVSQFAIENRASGLQPSSSFGITGTARIATNTTPAAPLHVGKLPSTLDLSIVAEGNIQTVPAESGNQAPTLGQVNDSLPGIADSVEELILFGSPKHSVLVTDSLRGGWFTWQATGTADKGITFAGSNGYWVRAKANPVKATWFGAVGDGIVNDNQAIADAVAYAISRNIGIIEVNVPKLLIDSVDCQGVAVVGMQTVLTGRFDNAKYIRGFIVNDYDREISPAYIPPAMTRSNKMCLYRNDDSTFYAITKKPRGYLLTVLRKNIVTTDDSEGLPTDLLRTTIVHDIDDAYLTSNSAPTKSGTWSYYEYFRGTHGIVMHINTTAAQNAYIEFSFTGAETQLGLMSSASGSDVEVRIDGNIVETFNTTRPTAELFTRKYANLLPGTHTIRVTKTNAGGNMYVCGVNFYSLKDAPVASYDSMYYYRNNTTYPPYIFNSGAQEYAVMNYKNNRFAGSYHGGETLISRDVRLDGIATDILSIKAVVCNNIDITQRTVIKWSGVAAPDSLNTMSTLRFFDSGYEFRAAMDGEVHAKRFFTAMTTTSDLFDELLFPYRIPDISTASLPIIANNRVSLGRVNMIVQRHAASGRKVTTSWNVHPNDNLLRGGAYIWIVPGAYNKLYYALNEDRLATVKNISFTVQKIFE